ncbi:MAG: hypothetical protein K9N51_04730 [Candidatus Pacebacteria bacterium]|nr:hypothetical protein [Candidatus Paceibacterota bacterium]
MKCQQAQTIIIETTRDKLPGPVAAHLETCEACRSFAVALKRAGDVVPRVEPPSVLDQRILRTARMRQGQAAKDARNAAFHAFHARHSWLAAAAVILAVFTAVLWTVMINSPTVPENGKLTAWQDVTMEEEMMLIAAELEMLDLNGTVTASTD